MKLHRKRYFLILLTHLVFINVYIGNEEVDTIFLSPNTEKPVNLTNRGFIFIDSTEIWENNGLETFRDTIVSFKRYRKNVFKYRNSFSAIFTFFLKTNASFAQNYVLEFTNSEVDDIQIMLFQNDSIFWISEKTGDKYVFNSREINHRFFAFELNLQPNSKYQLVLAVNKKDRTLTSNIFVFSKENWDIKIQGDALFNGVFQGLFISFILIGIIMFVFLKQIIFLYYGLYALMVFFLLFTINGYSFQYIYPNHPIVQQQSTIIIQIAGLIFLNLYAFKFVQFNLYNKVYAKIKYFLVGLYSFFILLAFLSIWFPFTNQKPLAIILYIFEFLNFTSLLLIPLFIYVKHKKKEALVFFLSYAFVGVSLFYAILSFLIEDLPYVPMMTTLNFALFIEMISLLLYMVFNYRSILQQKIVAENQLFESQKLNQQAFIDGQEKEKREIALNIHDNISSNLFALKNKINLIPISEVELLNNDIDIISKELRDISHELLPATLEDLGLESALNDLLQNFSSFFVVHLHCQDLPKNISKNMSIHIYRIFQELLKNAAKHANAKNVYVQLFGETDSLEIQYEDDGVGFTKSSKNIGLGFKSINYRVNLLKGNISVESEVNKGLLINISIPY